MPHAPLWFPAPVGKAPTQGHDTVGGCRSLAPRGRATGRIQRQLRRALARRTPRAGQRWPETQTRPGPSAAATVPNRRKPQGKGPTHIYVVHVCPEKALTVWKNDKESSSLIACAASSARRGVFGRPERSSSPGQAVRLREGRGVWRRVPLRREAAGRNTAHSSSPREPMRASRHINPQVEPLCTGRRRQSLEQATGMGAPGLRRGRRDGTSRENR